MGLSLRQIKSVFIVLVVLAMVAGVGWFQGSFAKDETAPTAEKVFPSSSECKKCHIRGFEEYE